MNFMDFIGKSYSRKAAVVIVAIAALTYIATIKIEQGVTLDPAIIKWSVIAIGWIGTLGIIAQAAVDWRKPKSEQPEQEISTTLEIKPPGE